MFDTRTAELMRLAPSMPGLNADDLPKTLTRHYARLVSNRLAGAADQPGEKDEWPVDRIADVYEIVASLEAKPELRRAAAFVAGTAQQIIARRARAASVPLATQLIDRDGVDASVAASLLFLAAEQYADANEAGGAIVIPQAGLTEARELGRHVRDLVRGNLGAILERRDSSVERRRAPPKDGRLQRSALRAMLSALGQGVEHLAAHLLAGADEEAHLSAATAAFKQVLALSSQVGSVPLMLASKREGVEAPLVTRYPGPAHLASLLLLAAGGIAEAALTRLPAPAGADGDFWERWLRFRADQTPYVWRNHREAIAREFHLPGKSAVLVLPTGAGKTTVSVLKIAGTLARGKKVVFLAPTHALVDQLTDDLQALFPADQFALQVSGDFDSLLLDDAQLKDIEVMTPERCLAMLSFAPEAFAQVGLLVFDECHLLSPSRKIGRALDSMLCVLAFHSAAPEADLLFLSAMLRNGNELAAWIAELTRRPCEPIDLLWKPSRQARGVVVYNGRKLTEIENLALSIQRQLDQKKGKRTKGLRAEAERALIARPWVIWGLQHNWMNADHAYTFTRVTDAALPLAGGTNGQRVWVTPNANKTAAAIARNACATGLKTIIFVNTKADAVRTAADIAKGLDPVALLPEEEALMAALAVELGDRRHSIFGEGSLGAVPHNAAMLRLERSLAEKLFRRRTGAQVIVATPTLAQGLNLPAELAILAGDKRSGDAGREDLEAHELLNAAARAGRAGHLANGVVILIPDPVIPFRRTQGLNQALREKLKSVLPEDDRCISVIDPLETVLDRVMAGEMDDRDVRYTVNRLAALSAADGGAIAPGNLLLRSFAAYRARARAEEAAYMAKVNVLWAAASAIVDRKPDGDVLLLASQSGLAIDLLDRLRVRLQGGTGDLPLTIAGWLDWILDWLKEDEGACRDLLGDTSRAINSAIGRLATAKLDAEAVEALRGASRAWLEGTPLNEIERLLGGDPEGTTAALRILPRAREFVGSVVPRALAFIAGVVARLVEELALADAQPTIDEAVLKSLAASVRRGFDTVAKLEFANSERALVGRVEAHIAYHQRWAQLLDDLDDLDDP